MKRSSRVLWHVVPSLLLLVLAARPSPGAGTYSWADATGTLRTNPTSASGTATLLAFGQRIPTSYTLDAQNRFTANGTWSGANTGWKALPGTPGVEYRVTNPRITVSVSSSPATLTAVLTLGNVEVQTTARAPDGTPVAQARLAPGQIQIPFGGDVTLNLPQLPTPSPRVADPYCDASCGFLGGVSLPGTAVRFDGKIAVPAGSVFPNGRLDYVNQWHSECEIFRFGRGTGDCKSAVVCLPGTNWVQGNDPVRCVAPAPAIPRLPASVALNVETLLQ